MSDQTDPATVWVDGLPVDVTVADDPEQSRTIALKMTVSASEKASTGQYENIEPYQSVTAAFSPALDISTKEGRDHLRSEAIKLHYSIQNDLRSTVRRRLKGETGDPAAGAER